MKHGGRLVKKARRRTHACMPAPAGNAEGSPRCRDGFPAGPIRHAVEQVSGSHGMAHAIMPKPWFFARSKPDALSPMMQSKY